MSSALMQINGAIDYAKDLLGNAWNDRCKFENRNALRYRTKTTFDLVWSSGLFDYLEERLAAHLLKLMCKSVEAGGRVVIGNFAETHSTRPWIEWCGDWFLIHRTLQDMQSLVEKAEIDESNFKIHHEIDSLNAVRYLTIIKN